MKTTPKTKTESTWWLSWYKDPPTDTRGRILFAAFQEVHINGFQAASIQNIMKGAGVTKGGLYHHFPSKDDIGIALLDEIFTKYLDTTFIAPLLESDDPITALLNHLQGAGAQMTDEDVALGCPMDRFSTEMAPINSVFQQKMDALYQRKQEGLVKALKRGQEAGNVTNEVSAESIALMISATLNGCMSMAKSARSLDLLMQCAQGLFHYLEQLRPVR